MSLTLYFYKVKKGTIPTNKTKEWRAFRRMYETYDYMVNNMEFADSKEHLLYRFKQEDIKAFYHILNHIIMYWKDSYDEECERLALNWLLKRKFDFNKYDYFILSD